MHRLLLLIIAMACLTVCYPVAKAAQAREPGAAGNPAGQATPAYTLEYCRGEMDSADAFRRLSAVANVTTYFTVAEARTLLPQIERLAVDDPESMVREAALRKLTSLAKDPLVYLEVFTSALSDQSETVRGIGATQLGQLGLRATDAVPELLKQLTSNTDGAGDRAATALRNIDQDAMLNQVPRLLGELGHGLTEQRAAAAYALGCIGPFTTTDTGTATWADMDCHRPQRIPGGLHFYTGMALKESLPPVSGELELRVSAVPAALLSALAHDESREVKLMAIRSLGRFQQYSLVNISQLAAYLADADPQFRRAAVTALAEIGPSGGIGIEQILPGLDDQEHSVVFETLRVLREWDGEKTAALPRLREMIMQTSISNAWATDITVILTTMGPAAAPAVPELIQYYRRDFEMADPKYIEALGAIGPDAAAAIPVLADLLTENTACAPLAAVALSQIDPDGDVVLDTLRWGLNEECYGRAGCAIGLGNITWLPDEVIEELIAGLDLENAMGTDTACCHALRDKADRLDAVIPALAATLATEGPVPSAFAGLALIQNGETHPELAAEILAELEGQGLLGDHRGGMVAGWLVKDDAQAVSYLLHALLHRDHNYYSSTAAYGLAERGEAARAAVPGLLDCLATEDPGLQMAAAYALTQIDPEKLTPFLPQFERWINGPQSEFRLQVVWVLGELGSHAAPALPTLRMKVNDPEQETCRAAALAVARIEAKLDPATR